ncbi:MAG TPA: hypothetical protein VN328_00900 [Thermodesulfovibrionales bacterium]|nr:hypothetical protein [Thermodesulfovibrionales bacterium]
MRVLGVNSNKIDGKALRNYQADRAAPQELAEVEKKIYEIAGTVKMIGGDE